MRVNFYFDLNALRIDISVKNSRSMINILLLILLASCRSILSDPAFNGDAPGSPGSQWRDKPVGEMEGEKIPTTTVNPYTEEDLSKSMSVSQLIDIALFNNPSTRVSWNAARAAAFNYYASLSEYYPSVEISGDLNAQHNVGGTGVSTSVISTQGGIVPFGGTTQGGVIAAAGALGAAKDPPKMKPLSPTAAAPSTTIPPDAKTNSSTFFNQLFVDYLLLDFGGRDGQAFFAYQGLVSANWQHNFTMQQVIMAVLDNYTNFLGNKGLAEADEQNLKDAEVALKAAEVMRRAGLATLTDVLQAQSAVEQARFNLEQARGAEKTAFGSLLITLGLPPTARIQPVDLPQELPVVDISGDVDSLLELAKRKRPDLQVALAAVRQQEANLQISYSSGMPTLTAQGVLTQSKLMHFASSIPSSTSPNRNLVKSNSISLNWDFPVFQGFFYYNQQRQIRAQIQEALANLDVQVANVSTQVVTNYYAFTTAAANLPNSMALLQSSQRAYRGVVSQYKVGVSSFLDMLNALTTLSNARAQLVLTRTQWAASLANLAFSIGILEETTQNGK